MYLTRMSTVVVLVILQALEALSDEGCKTVKDEQCIFPFKAKANGPDLYECTTSGGFLGYSRSDAWCATNSVNSDKTYKKGNWGKCKDGYCKICQNVQYNVGSVSCGQHNATSCSKCPCSREGNYLGESLYNSGIRSLPVDNIRLFSYTPP